MKEENQLKFAKLQSWGEMILNYLVEYYYSPDDWFSMELVEVFNRCVEDGRLSQMKMFIGDLTEIASGEMDMDLRIELNRILMEKFGEDLMTGMEKKMDGVLKRGNIRNDEEFIRVNEWIDHLLYDKENPDAGQQIELYNRLLRDYEDRVNRRLAKKS